MNIYNGRRIKKTRKGIESHIREGEEEILIIGVDCNAAIGSKGSVY